jgi:hypothetical protein
MLRFTDINWADVIASTDEPLRLCLRQNIAMYFKVRNSQLVYRHHTVSRGQSASADSIPAAKDGEQVAPAPALESSTSEQLVADATSGSSYPMGFDEELVYLRVQNKPLADLTSSPTSDVSSFDSGGFSMPRPSRLTGERDRRGWEIKTYDDITHPALMKVDFYHAFLVNKKRWELLKPNLAVAASTALEKCTESVEIALSDLYLTSSDVDALKKDLRNASEMVEYPFKHQESIPGGFYPDFADS